MQHPTAATAGHGAEHVVPDNVRCAGWGQRLRALATSVIAVAVGLVAVLTTSAPARAATSDVPRQMTLHVTDRGINQMSQWESGGEQGLTWAMSNLDPAARIAVVMPRGADFDRISTEDLRRQIFNNLKARIDAARRSGHAEVEIQLVQDINLAGYTGPRQEAVEHFGTAAYGAIRDIGAYLKRQDVKVTNRANLGSNGSVVFAANVDAWSVGGRAIWDSVDIFDGRAFLTPMVKVIDRIGPKRVRIFNTSLDIPAPHTPWVFRSLGNAATAQQLKSQYFPDLKVYKLTSVKGDWGHVAGMSPTAVFLLDEYVGPEGGYMPLPGIVSGAALRRPNSLPAAVARSIPADVKEGVAVWKSIAHDLVEALGKYADGFVKRHGEKHPLAHSMKRAASVASAIQAVNEDIAAAGEARVVFLKSRTMEELVKFVFEEVATSARFEAKHGQDVAGYTASVSALMELLRSGKPNADVVKNISTAAAVAAQRRVGEAHAVAVARLEAKISTLQLDATRLETHERELSRALRLGSGNRDIDRGRQSQLHKVSEQLKRTTKQLDDARDVAKVMQDRFRVASIGLDVLPDFAAAVAEHANQRRLTLDVVDRYSDAFLALTGSLAAAVIVTANPELVAFEPAIKQGLVATGKWMRDVPVRGLFDQRPMWEALDAYHEHQTFAARNGMKLETLSEFYGYKNLRRMGMSDRQIAEQDARARQMIEAALAHRPQDPSRPAPQASQQAPQLLPNLLPSGSPPSAQPSAQAMPKPALQAAEMQAESGSARDPKPATRKTEIVANKPEKPGPPTFVEVKKPRPKDEPLFPPDGRRGPPGAEGGGPGGGLRAPAGRDDNDPPCGRGGGTCGGIDLGLTALVIDPATRKIVALAEGGPPQTETVAPALMALALWLEYTGQRAAFSLDPYDPKDPKGPWLRAVYFPEALRGTVAGNQCFEADFLLKQMSFGVRVEGDRVVERRSDSGLLSVPELMGRQDGPTPEQWSRMWIVSREVRLTASDGIVRVEQARMGVEARRQVPDPSTRTGLRDVATPADATEQRFARQFEQLYDKLSATEAPSLAAVREVTKAIAIARWMRMNGVRIDMEAVVAQLNRARVPAVDKVSALSVGWTSQMRTPFSDGRGDGVTTTTRTLHVFGGVDLSVAPKVEKNSAGESLREAVVAKLRKPDAPARFELTHAGRVHRAYVMPFATLHAHTR